MSHFLGMSVFAQKKMCDYQRSSGHVVIRRVARLSRIGARLMYGPIRDPDVTQQVTTCPELRWKAHIFFWAKTDMPKK